MLKRSFVVLFALCLPLSSPGLFAAATKTQPNQVKGQQQMAGANGKFKVVYGLQSGFSFTILSARYSIDAFLGPDIAAPKTDEKLLILDFAINNAKPQDNWFATDDLFTAVDEKGGLYPHVLVGLSSKGSGNTDFTLRPGQGMGQPEKKDALRIAFRVPAKSRIVKIMVNQGRLTNKDEKVLRYYVAGATKAEAGEKGDPANVIAPLPDSVRDPADRSGAVALEEGKSSAGASLQQRSARGRKALRGGCGDR